jgi:hypothetical protein
MARMLMLLGIAAVLASPASAGLNPDPKPIPRPPAAPPPPVFQRVAPAPIVVHPTSADRAAANRRTASARAARLAHLRVARAQARAKAARAAAQKNTIVTRRQADPRGTPSGVPHVEAIAYPPKAKAAVSAASDPFLPVLLGFAIAFLILAASPASAIPWHGAARLLDARRGAFAICGAGGLVAVFVVMVL